MPMSRRQMSKLRYTGTVESSAAERKEEVPLCTAAAAKLSRHTVAPKKPDTTSYAAVHLYKTQKQAQLVCGDRGQNEGCLSRKGLGLG